MAKTLGSWLRSQMEACGLNNKDVAGRVHDVLVSAGVVASLDSVTTKFSKLLNGNEEGTVYYYAESEPARLEALAAALKTTASELQQRRAAFLRYRTLVLDPRLPQEQIEFLMRQEHDPAAAYSVVMPRDGLADPASAIKAAMVAAERPLAVLASDSIVELFRLTDLEVTTVTEVPRGFVLARYPDLVPVPPPRPLRLFDEDQPLIPIVAEVTSSDIYQAQDKPKLEALARQLERATREGETASLTLPDAIAWFTWRSDLGRDSSRYSCREIVYVDSPRITLSDVLGQRSNRTYVWTANRRIYAIGPDAARLGALIAPHHDVLAPQEIDDLRRATEAANPWQIIEHAKDEGHPLHRFAQEIPQWASGSQKAWSEKLVAWPTRNGRIANEAELRSARERFAALSRREAALECLSMLFVLTRLQEANLVVIDEGEDRPPAYLADLGAGNLALVRLRETSAPSTALSARSDFWRPPYVVDAGDIVFAVVPSSSALLEGSTLTARRNRRNEERQSSVEDDDY